MTPLPTLAAARQLGESLAERRIVVCCGAGGVGKTTTAAALALGSARAGRRVLVLTIDPSRRLAETLGISRNTPEPVELRPDDLSAAGVHPPGRLSAWVLDTRTVSDNAVRRLVRDPEEASRLLQNPIYQQMTGIIAGMQEYTAMEALYGFVERGRYDLVILDTPPSRNALNFLEAPGRLGEFLEGRVFKLMLPQPDGRVLGTTRRVVGRVLSGVFGDEFYRDLQVFFGSFSAVFAQLNGNAQRMRTRLQQDDVSFVLVTSPARAALEDALFFEDKIIELELPLGAFVLNRSRAAPGLKREPGEWMLPPDPTDTHRSALRKLALLARREQALVESHGQLLDELVRRADTPVPAVAVPELGQAVEDLAGLAELSGWLLGTRQSSAAPSSAVRQRT